MRCAKPLFVSVRSLPLGLQGVKDWGQEGRMPLRTGGRNWALANAKFAGGDESPDLAESC